MACFAANLSTQVGRYSLDRQQVKRLGYSSRAIVSDVEAGTRKRERIETDLRAAIDDRILEPGQALPSARELCDKYDVSRVTVRRALERLHADGLIDMRQGTRPRVRPAPLVKITIAAADWRRHRDAKRPGFNATVAEHGLIGRQEVLETKDPSVPPTHVAIALGLDDGALTVMRYVRMWADESRVRLCRMWFPATWASGTLLAGRGRIRGGVAGFIEDLLGVRLAFSDIGLEGRLPNDPEQRLLDLARGVSVIHTTTTFLDDGFRPVFVQEEISDASRHRWRFLVPL